MGYRAHMLLDGGTLRVTGQGFASLQKSIDVGANGAKIEVADVNGKLTLNQTISNANADLDKTGAGTLALTGPNTYHSVYAMEGTLSVSGTGRLDSKYGWIGNMPGKAGMVSIGNGGRWTNTDELIVGDIATGSLDITAAGAVNSNKTVIGNVADVSGRVSVSGAGASWVSNGTLRVGVSGKGLLDITDGAQASQSGPIAGVTLGLNAGSEGSVLVTGRNSLWDTGAMSVKVGDKGAGKVHVTDHGTVRTGTVALGFSGGKGDVLVSGEGANWSFRDALLIGRDDDASGTVEVRNGGKVHGSSVTIAQGNSTTGQLTVSGADGNGNVALLETTLSLVVGAGHEASGALRILEGGRLVTSGSISSIGNLGFSSGLVEVSGSYLGQASTWESNADILVGSLANNGVLAIRQGGVVNIGALSADGSRNGKLILRQDMNLIPYASQLVIGAQENSAPVEAGTLNAAAVSLVGAGSSSVVFNHIGQTTFRAVLQGDRQDSHHIRHLAGTTTLTGDSTGFGGTTIIRGGTLLVGDAQGNGVLGGQVDVNTNGTLGGSGRLAGSVHVDGVLSAGNSPGTLRIDGNLFLNNTARSVFELGTAGVAGGGTNDLVSVGGNLHLGGELQAKLAAAGRYQLFDYGTLSPGQAFQRVNLQSTRSGFLPASHHIDSTIDGKLFLSVLGSGQTLQHWNGAQTQPSGAAVGGDGIWSNWGTNWMNLDGSASAGWAGSVGVFGGQAGMVDVDTTHGPLVFDTLQFSTDGYALRGGVLAIGASGGGTFNIDNGVSAQVGSAIADSAGTRLVKTGGGTLSLTGQNTYSGGTQVLGGVLSVAGDGALGATGGGLLLDDATLRVTGNVYGETARSVTLGAAGGAVEVMDQGHRFVLAQGVTGAGGLRKLGDGILRLGGTGSYTGGTQVVAGTLEGTAASIRGDIANAGTVVFQQADDAAFAGQIDGLSGASGTMVKRGAGTLTLDGASTLDWAVEAGSLRADASRFSGDARIDQGAALALRHADGAVYGGALTGAGDLSLQGSGIIALTGDSAAFAGTTSLDAGSVLTVGVNGTGSLGGSLSVGAGAVLGGTGTLGSAGSAVTVAAGAVHAPGNSIGTQVIAGDYVNHGTLRIEATPDAADKVVVAGAVDISGATLDLSLSPGNAAAWNIFNGPFTILEKQSQGGVTGTFGHIAQNLLFLDQTVDYAGGDGNDVTLSLTRNDQAFAGVGRTANQMATGGAIDALGTNSELWRAIALQNDPDTVRASYDTLSGEIHASARTALIEDSRLVRQAANHRLRAASGASGGVLNAPALRRDANGVAQAVSPADRGPAVWSQALGAWGATRSDGNAARLSRSAKGVLIGADRMLGDWRMGVLAGYSNADIRAGARESKGKSDNYHAGVYGGMQRGNVSVRAGAAYTWHRLDVTRTVRAPGLSDALKSKYRGASAQAYAELGVGLDAGPVRLEPYAGLAYVALRTNGADERGGQAALRIDKGRTETTFSTLGLRAEHAVSRGGVDLALTAGLGWRHAFGDTVPQGRHAFGDAASFAVAGAPIARNSVAIEAGLAASIGKHTVLGLSYIGQQASDARDHGVRLNLTARF